MTVKVWICQLVRREVLGLLTLHVSASLLAAAHSVGRTGKSSELRQPGCTNPSPLFLPRWCNHSKQAAPHAQSHQSSYMFVFVYRVFEYEQAAG